MPRVIKTLPAEHDEMPPETSALSRLPMPVESDGEESAVDSLLSELGGIDESGAKVMIYRAAGSGRKVDAFLYSCSPREFSIEELSSKFGGGDYRIKGYRYNPEIGRRVLFVNQQVSIDPGIKPETETAPAIAPAAPADLAPLVAAMSAGFEKLGTLIVQAQPPAQSRADMLRELAMMREILGPSQVPAAPGLTPADMIALLQQGIELGRVSGGETDALSEMTRGLMPLLARWAEKEAAQPKAAPVQMPPLPILPAGSPVAAPSNVPPAAPIQSQPQPEGTADMLQLRAALGMLCQQAARNADPSLYAELVADQAPDAVLQEFLNAPNWFETLCGFNPTVRNYQAWFFQLRDELERLLTESEEGADNPPHSTGAGADAGNADTRRT